MDCLEFVDTENEQERVLEAVDHIVMNALYATSFSDGFFFGYWYSFIYNYINLGYNHKKYICLKQIVKIIQINNKFSCVSISYIFIKKFTNLINI